MQATLANPRGFCAGVDRAIDIVNRALDLRGTGLREARGGPQQNSGQRPQVAGSGVRG